jgi:hypothetical protein
MLTFATVAAGKPSGMAPLTRHMLTQTVPREVADMDRYYTRGLELGVDQAMMRQDMHPLVAPGLGVDPTCPVGVSEINALLAGRRADGEKIEGKRYLDAREYIDRRTGLSRKKIPIGSVDFCLTPDKSVSVAWAFADTAERAAIYQAHRDAAHSTMAFIEKEMGQTTRGMNGRDGYEAGHLGWIAFDHYTARPTLWMAHDKGGERITESIVVQVAGDPDLHTHFTVMNAVFCESGRVGSMDLDRLDGLIKLGGALYQAHLATNLKRIGAEVVLDKDTGAARLTTIPENVRDHFSKKTLNGEEAARTYAKEQGLDWDDLSEDRRVALLKAGTQGIPAGLDAETIGRLKKDDMADFADWRRQAAELDWKHESIVSHHPPLPELTREQRLELAYPHGVEWLEKDINRRAVISEADVRTAAARSFIASGIEDYRDIDRMAEMFKARGVKQYGEDTRLMYGPAHGGRWQSISTALHMRDENEFIKKAREAAADKSDALRPEQVKRAIRSSGLTFDSDHGQAQLDAIERLGTGGRLGVMIGAAGAGKSTIMRPLVSAWREDGRDVHGIALAWRQADDWIDAGIDPANAKAVKVFFDAVAAGEITLTSKSVVVVDEMSLIGTRQALDLLRLQADHSFRVVMLGDDKQCQSIEAGPIIELARRALGDEQVPEILTTVRQKSEREREIVGLLRTGETLAVAQALAMKREDGTAEMVPGGYREAIQRTAELVSKLLREHAHDRNYVLTVSAPTNMDAHRLSAAIRETRRELGQIGRDQVTVKAADRDGQEYEMALAAGDKVRLFQSTRVKGERGSIGRNGTVLTVLTAGSEGLTVRNDKGREGVIDWKALTSNGLVRLAYGEVRTTHTAQGSTATDHIYALPNGTRAVVGFSAYSSGTRHKQNSYLLISEGAERQGVAHGRPINDYTPIRITDVWSHAAENLSRMPEKALAIDLFRRSKDTVDRNARELQKHGMAQERRERAGKRRMVLSQRLNRAHDTRGLNRAASDLEHSVRRSGPALTALGQVNQKIEQVVSRTFAKQKPALQKALGCVVKGCIPQDHIAQLKHSVSLTHLIGQTVQLDHHGKGLCPFHEEKTPSFHVDEKKGHYHCFGCGCHGDAVKWLMDGCGMNFPDVVSYLEGRSGIVLPPPIIDQRAAKQADWVPIEPIPAGVPPLVRENGWTARIFNPKQEGTDRERKAYRPAHVAPYQDTNGNRMGYVLRVELNDGRKFTPQVTWAVPAAMAVGIDPVKAAKEGRWALVAMAEPRPLYHSEALNKSPDAPVIVVMGEKKADALQATLGDQAVVVSWPGGDHGRGYVDFSALKGRDVVIWPDADLSGKAAAVGEVGPDGRLKRGSAELIEAAGAARVRVLVPPTTVEKGWDAGDLIKGGADRQKVETFIAERAVSPADARRVFDRQKREAPQRTVPRPERQPSRGPSIER